MSTASKPEETPAAPTASAESVNSPVKAPAKSTPSQITRNTSLRTERPIEPPNIGNPKAMMLLKLDGQLGVFYDRNRTTRIPTLIDINFDAIRTAATRVIGLVLKQQAQMLNQLDVQSITALVEENARILANGVCVMTYSKLHMVNYLDHRVAERFRRKPKVPAPFEVPQPYALAISQLGKIKLSGAVDEIYLSPVAPEHADVHFGCFVDHPWSPALYSGAVEFAKKLGLRFSGVDLTVKMGSSWWLYRPVGEQDNFRLDCPYPEENFTVNTAVLASLFCTDAEGGFNNAIINPAVLGPDTYGSMLRNLPHDLCLDTYYAITEQK